MKPESMPLVMRRLHSQHPFVTARTKIIFLVKASGALDFDARWPSATMMNPSSDVDGRIPPRGDCHQHGQNRARDPQRDGLV
jgi:hypothetical protein